MRCVLVAPRAKPAVDGAEQLLEQTRQLATLGLAQFFVIAGQPCDLDHAAFARVRQMSVEGIVCAFEYRKIAEDGLDLWRGEVVDPVGEAIVMGTAAVALATAGRVNSPAEAEVLAKTLWSQRDRRLLPLARKAA